MLVDAFVTLVALGFGIYTAKKREWIFCPIFFMTAAAGIIRLATVHYGA